MSSPGRGGGLDFEGELNPEQLAAVTHGDGPQLVIAGAGSGKTRVITYRIAWLIQERQVDPRSIVAVTFTNKAASEMRERVEQLVQRHPLSTFVGTFHRYALMLLRRYGPRVGLKREFAIFDSDDQLKLVKEQLKELRMSEKAFAPRAVLAAISNAKNKLQDAETFESQATQFFERKVATVYRRYQGTLQQLSAVDFDDMITLAVRLLEQDPEIGPRLRSQTRHLLVDEFQDTNHAQLRMVRALSSPKLGGSGNLTAVGDEDQGIYRWRGADLDNILDFERHFPDAEVRKLEQNYRSTQTILDAAGAVVANNRGRRGKKLWTDGETGEPLQLYKASDELDEARWLIRRLQRFSEEGDLGLRSMAILVRTNAQTRALEEELLRRGMPYELVGGVRFYQRAEIKDLIAYLRVLRNPRDDFSFNRILNQPPRGIGKSTQGLLQDRAQELGQPIWDVLIQDELGTLPARSAKSLRAFRDLVVQLQRLAEDLPLPALLEQLLAATGYTDLYNPEDPDGQARLENIREFLSAAQEFSEQHSYQVEDEDLLSAFLDHVSLVADVDGWKEEGGVSLMTLHSAKGLEFPVVVLPGLEDGLLPHFNAQKGEEDLEEERRLLYVGMTRARERLLLSTCQRRRIAGRYQDQKPSAFLDEVPAEHVEITESPSLAPPRRTGSDNVYGFFGGGPRSSQPRRRSPDPSIEYFPDADDGEGGTLRKGSKVRHPTLGSGTILELDGSGDTMKITAYFDRAGKRKLVAKYANLEVL